MRIICKLDVELYSCVTPNITTDEVVITDKQIEHIMQRHPGDYERYVQYMTQIITEPDYILAANKPNTAFILKHIIYEDINIQLILRLKTVFDDTEYKNSVITFLKIDNRKWSKYLRNKKVLYKRP